MPTPGVYPLREMTGALHALFRVVGIPLVLLLAGSATARSGIRVDGSSTVYPISLAMAEEFYNETRLPVTVAFSGTGGGFSKLCASEIDVADASRVINRDELAHCAAAGIEVLELPVAADALTLVVNSANDFVECLTLQELRAIWAPDSDVGRWSQVRPGFPDEPLTLYGPGAGSGTFDFFTLAVNGGVGRTRTDYFPSEDDNVLVLGVEGDRYALGYFGYAYYARNSGRVKAVAVDAGTGCVAPDPSAIAGNTYVPFSRPLLIYVSAAALTLKRPLEEFIGFYLAPANRGYIAETGYVTYPDAVYEAVSERFRDRVPGSALLGFSPGDDVLELLEETERR